MRIDEILYSFGKALIPERFRSKIKRYFEKAGLEEEPYTLFGALIILGFILLVLAIIFIYPRLPFARPTKISSSLMLFLTIFLFSFTFLGMYFLIVFGIISFIYDYKIYMRTRTLEEILPDFLNSLSENLKGGTTFEEALFNSIKPEFGEFSKEINLVAKKIATGKDTAEALMEFAEKYDSPEIKRTFSVISEALESGGKITPIIDKIATSLNEVKALKRDIAATNMNYVMFIVLIVGFVAPFLYSLSVQFLRIIQAFTTRMSKVTATPVSEMATPLASAIFNVESVALTPQDFIGLSYILIGITAAFSGMIISIIRTGSIKSGLKYIPMLVILSLTVYMGLLKILSNFFSALTA